MKRINGSLNNPRIPESPLLRFCFCSFVPDSPFRLFRPYFLRFSLTPASPFPRFCFGSSPRISSGFSVSPFRCFCSYLLRFSAAPFRRSPRFSPSPFGRYPRFSVSNFLRFSPSSACKFPPWFRFTAFHKIHSRHEHINYTMIYMFSFFLTKFVIQIKRTFANQLFGVVYSDLLKIFRDGLADVWKRIQLGDCISVRILHVYFLYDFVPCFGLTIDYQGNLP